MFKWLLGNTTDFKHYAKASRLGKIKKDIPLWDVIVLGSTQINHAIDFSLQSDISGENLTFDVQPFFYDQLLLKRFAGNVKKGGIVIFGISPFNFLLYDFFPAMRSTCRFKRYYFIFGPDFHSDCSADDCRKTLKSFAVRKFMHCLIKMKKQECLDFTPAKQQGLSQEALQADALKKQKDFHKNFFRAPDFKQAIDETTVEKNIQILDSGITFAKSMGLKPMILIVPNAREFYEIFDEEVLEKYLWQPLEKVVQKNPVPILNYMKDPRFAESQNFSSALSLSSKGREKFTDELIYQIKCRKIC